MNPNTDPNPTPEPKPDTSLPQAPIEVDTDGLHTKPNVDYDSTPASPTEEPHPEVPPGPEKVPPGPDTSPA